MQTFQEGNSQNGYGTACLLGSVATALGAGALLMYLFDPERGRGRRSRIGDQLSSKANHIARAAGSKSRDLRNRAKGVAHDLGLVGRKEKEKGATQPEAL